MNWIPPPRAINFTNRVRELTFLKDATSQRSKPVISVTGPGGAGKTALVSEFIFRKKAIAVWIDAARLTDETERDVLRQVELTKRARRTATIWVLDNWESKSAHLIELLREHNYSVVVISRSARPRS